jgi:hypothetical protein
VDVRPLLPLVQAPTLVLHRRDFPLLPIEHGRYLAEHLPNARLVELPGADGPLTWEHPEVTLGHIEEFLTGVRQHVPTTRVLATVLFTDIVGSTERAAELGDRRWRELLGVHDDLSRRLVEQWGGRVVKTTGDGILATFDGPGRAIACAVTLREQLGDIDPGGRRWRSWTGCWASFAPRRTSPTSPHSPAWSSCTRSRAGSRTPACRWSSASRVTRSRCRAASTSPPTGSSRKR